MKLKEKKPARRFEVGPRKVMLKDCGTLELDSDEQITLLTPDGKEYDVVRKEWGFYATPSLNKRLVGFGLMPALTVSDEGKYYLVLVEKEARGKFKKYCHDENLKYYWLTDESLKEIERALAG